VGKTTLPPVCPLDRRQQEAEWAQLNARLWRAKPERGCQCQLAEGFDASESNGPVHRRSVAESEKNISALITVVVPDVNRFWGATETRRIARIGNQKL
jgi:hypothetical protein